MKVIPTSKYLFKRQLNILGIVFLYVIGFLVVLPFVFSLLTGNIGDFSLKDILTGSPVGTVLNFYIIAIAALSYENYKFLIQNGISRSTFYKSQLQVLLLLSLICTLISQAYTYIVYGFLNAKSAELSVMQDTYGHTISNPFVKYVIFFVFSYLIIVSFAMSSMAVGGFLSLFSRRIQVILIIGLPIAGIVLLISLVNFINQYGFTNSIGKFIVWIFGFDYNEMRNEGVPTKGSPYRLMIAMAIWDIVMAYLAKIFYNRKQIKKD